MTETIDAVLFDLDRTLCEYERRPGEVLSAAFEAVGVEPLFAERDYLDAYDEFADESEDMLDLRERCFAALAERAGGDPDVGREVAAAFADERDQRNVAFLPGGREALDALADEYPVGLVTNGSPEMQRQKLAGLGIADRFEVTVFAGYDTPQKPHPEPFRSACEALGVAPSRTAYVGDSLESDVAGAEGAGLQSVLVSADPVADAEPTPAYRVESLRDLVPPPWR